MSRDKEILFIAIGAQRIDCGVLSNKQWAHLHSVPIEVPAVTATSMEAMLVALETLTEMLRKPIEESTPVTPPRIRVLISDRWLAMASIPWSPLLARKGKMQAYVRDHLGAAGFQVGNDDSIRLDDAPYRQPTLAIAYSTQLLAELNKLAKATGATLQSVMPLGLAAWIYACRQARDLPELLAVQEGEWVSFAGGRGGHVASISSSPVLNGASGDVDALSAHWRRLRLRDPQLNRVQRLHVLDLNHQSDAAKAKQTDRVHVELPIHSSAAVPATLQLATMSASIRSGLDAINIPAPMSAFRLILAGLILILTSGVVYQTWLAASKVEVQQRALAAMAPVDTSSKQPAAFSREEQSRIQVVNKAIRELNLPVSGLLRALQPPRDIRVALLGIEVTGDAAEAMNSRGSVMKITAEARTGAEMARYVSYLSDQRPFTGAYLVRHEIVESISERPYRFTVETTWRE